MPFDAIFLKSMVAELNKACLGGKIDKVNMPEKDRILLSVRTLGKNVRILFCANANSPRIQMTDMPFDNPDVPPMFCMLLRKHILGGKITEIKQMSFERAVKFTFAVTNELFEKDTKSLVLEVLGRQSNVILLDSEDRIIDSLKKVSFNENASRQVLPGAKYKLPDSMNKINPFEDMPLIRAKIVNDTSSLSAEKLLMTYIMGLSPLISREIVSRCGVTGHTSAQLDQGQKSKLCDCFEGLLLGEYKPVMLINEKGSNDFTVCDIKQYGEDVTNREYESFSQLLDAFFTEDNIRESLQSKSASLTRFINSSIEKISKKLSNQLVELAESRDREKYKVYGELITANLHKIEKGASKCVLENYYDDMQPLTVPLDSKISAAKNAQKYFKKYSKLKTAEEILGSQIEQGKAELDYFKKLADTLKLARTPDEIEDMRAELAQLGYIKEQTNRKKRSKPSVPYRFTSKNGFEIYVGRNNIQNDYLTHKFASKSDYWLHTLNITGSHVILVTNGKQVPDDDIVEAAEYAAYYSSARGEEKVPVTYTPAKFVKKPNGAKPGFVIYSTSDTIYVSGASKA